MDSSSHTVLNSRFYFASLYEISEHHAMSNEYNKVFSLLFYALVSSKHLFEQNLLVYHMIVADSWLASSFTVYYGSSKNLVDRCRQCYF